MKDDGHIGGEKCTVQKGARDDIKSSHNGGQFTAIGLTSVNNDPVMTIVIFAETELSFVRTMGYKLQQRWHCVR